MEKIVYKDEPFEGGVVGMIDYHIYTVFYFPTGVVDSLCIKISLQKEGKCIRLKFNTIHSIFLTLEVQGYYLSNISLCPL